MAKVKNPLLSGDVSGDFGKQMIFRKGGVVTRMFRPRNPRSAAQQAHRQAFKEYWMAALTQAIADLLYAALDHLHDDRYLQDVPQQDHGGLAGLGDDDHSQYHNNTRGDARYAPIAHSNASLAVHGLPANVNMLGNRNAASEFVQRGSAAMDGSENSTGSPTIYYDTPTVNPVVFPVPFSAAPIVIAVVSNGYNAWVRLSGITPTGFSASVMSTNSGQVASAQIHWIAIGP